ncbi:MAG: NAD(P)/FAD-dependent oxidoreductase [Haloarculaceae archaeon]
MHVAVLGAGYAGLALARRLERRLPADVDLTVVDETDHHLLKHEIHRPIRRPAVADELTVPLAEVLDRADVVRARVTDVDLEAGVATFEDGEELAYDAGAVCLGADVAYYDLPGVAEHALPLERLGDAAEIRAAAFDAFESGDAAIVVGGAGLSGVQVAGELAALARAEGVADETTIHLLEQLPAVAPSFPPKFQRAVRDALDARDVRVETGATVTGADAETVRLEDREDLPADAFVWTGGIRGTDALAGERPIVQSRLRLAGDTFVVGDAGRVVDADGEAVPASAQAAVREARVAADNLVRLVEHRREGGGGFEPRLSTFGFDSPGWLVSVGDGAVAQVGSTVLTGRSATALKTSVGAGYLTSIGSVRRAFELVADEFGADVREAVARERDEQQAGGESDEPDEPIRVSIDDERPEDDSTDDE